MKTLSHRLNYFIATGSYSGLAKKAPGTCGSLAAMLLLLLLGKLIPTHLHFSAQIGLSALLTTLSITSCNALLKQSNASTKDPQEFVIDEFTGFFISTIGLSISLSNAILCFALFRFFDISKLPPIKKAEKLPRGYGITLDDLIAGIYANVLASLITGEGFLLLLS